MDMKDAAELTRKWGGKPCSHPRLVKERDIGGLTGDYVCTTCGEARPKEQWPQLKN